MKVYVVTNPEYGWDNVLGVYEKRVSAEAFVRSRMKDPSGDVEDQMDMIHEKELQDENEEIRS